MSDVMGKDVEAYVCTHPLVRKLTGDFSTSIKGFCSLNHPKEDAITWIKHPSEGILDGFDGLNNIITQTSQAIKTCHS